MARSIALAFLLCADLLSVKSKYSGEDKPGNSVWLVTGEVDGKPTCTHCPGDREACAASKKDHPDACTVHYFTAGEQAAVRVHYDKAQGKWLQADGQPLDTRARIEAGKADGSYRTEKAQDKVARWGAPPALWAMDEQGEFYVSTKARTGVFHHSSILAGAKVICAGTIDAVDGKILHLDNQSGHYQPTPEALDEALRILREKHGAEGPIPHEVWKAPKKDKP
jgi:hypothetical protein